MQVSLDEIRSCLRQIQFPGLSRDIVSFGMVKNIEIDDRQVRVDLEVTAQQPGVGEQIRRQAEGAISRMEGVQGVSVTLKSPAIREPGNQPVGRGPQSQRPGGDPFAAQAAIPGVEAIIAVASGKGGVGKSTIAVNLAKALQGRGNAVGILDADVYGPSLPTLLRLSGKPTADEQNKMIPLEKDGLRVMSMGFLADENTPVIWRGPIVTKLIKQFLRNTVWGDLDYLVMDLPPGTGDVQLTLVQQLKMTGAVIVSTPQELALLDAKKGAEMFRKVGTPVLGLIENMSYFLCPHCDGRTDIFRTGGGERASRQLGVPFLGQIPIDPEIMKTCEEGTPIVEHSPGSAGAQAIQVVLDRLLEKLQKT